VKELLLCMNDSGVCMKFPTPCHPSVRMSFTKDVYHIICLTGSCSGSTLHIVFGTYQVSLQPADQTPPIQNDKYQCHIDTVISPDDGQNCAPSCIYLHDCTRMHG